MPEYHDVSAGTSDLVTAVRSMGRAGICMHSTEGKDSLGWLQGGSAEYGKPASADFLVARNGDVYQITEHMHYAYHVGIATWRNVVNSSGRVNMLLVGIEIESHETDTPRYTDEQLITSAALVRVLMQYHRLGVDSIVRHADVALPPGRRKDPVNFPFYIWTKELLIGSVRRNLDIFPELLP